MQVLCIKHKTKQGKIGLNIYKYTHTILKVYV